MVQDVGSSWSLRIGQLQVPSLIRNGSVSDVVLDCDYSLDPGESADGIVVKWFLNYQTNPLPVYQWITNKIPQDLGVLRGRLNLGYRATDEPSTRHRALNIINPTIELSGEYRCLVSSFFGEDTKAKKMIIYVPEESLELTQSKSTEEGQARLSCEADGVFPRPELAFIHKETGKVLEGAQIRVTDRKDGLYDIEADIQVDEAPYEDGEEHTFGCELSIPEANYTLTEWQIYEPRHPLTTTTPAAPTAPAAPADPSPSPEAVPDEGQGEGVPLESMHRSASDGKEQNALRNALPESPSGGNTNPACMDNATALKFTSFRLRHQFKMRCRNSGAAELSRLSLPALASLAMVVAALAGGRRRC